MTTEDTTAAPIQSVDDIDTSTMTGDVRDLILGEMRDAKDHKPWTERNEDEQDAMIDRATRFADRLIAKLVREIAVMGRPSVTVQIKEWKVGDALKIAAEGIVSEHNATTLLHGGKIAHIVFGGIEDVRGERGPATATPDQGALELEHDEDGVVFDNTEAGAA